MKDLFQKIQIDLKQGSQEWLDWRRDKIGASDAPVIMGVSPYKDRATLLKEKITGHAPIKPGMDYIFKKGHAVEDMQLLRMEAAYNINLTRPIFMHKDYDFIHASLDGFSVSDDEVFMWECKLVDKKAFELGQIPPKYVPQLMQQLWVVSSHIPEDIIIAIKFILTIVSSDGRHKDIPVPTESSLDSIALNLKPAVMGFYEHMKNNAFPEEIDISNLAEEYIKIKDERDDLNERLDELKAALFEKTDGVEIVESGRVRLTRIPASTKRVFDLEMAKEDYPELVHMRYYKTKETKESKRITISNDNKFSNNIDRKE